jgi:hypothetical protein
MAGDLLSSVRELHSVQMFLIAGRISDASALISQRSSYQSVISRHFQFVAFAAPVLLLKHSSNLLPSLLVTKLA